MAQLTESSAAPPKTAMRFSAFRFAVYSLSRWATTSSAFSPFIHSSFPCFSMGQGCQLATRYLKQPTSIPRSSRVLLISIEISFLSLLASSKESHRLILRKKDSKCRAPVLTVISSILAGRSNWGAWWMTAEGD
jgi:hypothetical protein